MTNPSFALLIAVFALLLLEFSRTKKLWNLLAGPKTSGKTSKPRTIKPKSEKDLRRDLKAASFTSTEQTVGVHPKFAASLGMAKWTIGVLPSIYRHSRNLYDPAEWMFPGANLVNGTVEGAMKAGMEAYPM